MSEQKPDYIVVFQYNSRAGGYAGVITWSSYPSKEVFDAQYRHSYIGDQCVQEVVEEGVTAERAVKLCRSTPLVSRLRAALQEATDPATGKVDEEIFHLNLFPFIIVKAH